MSTCILDIDHLKGQRIVESSSILGLSAAIAVAIAEERERCAGIADKMSVAKAIAAKIRRGD